MGSKLHIERKEGTCSVCGGTGLLGVIGGEGICLDCLRYELWRAAEATSTLRRWTASSRPLAIEDGREWWWLRLDGLPDEDTLTVERGGPGRNAAPVGGVERLRAPLPVRQTANVWDDLLAAVRCWEKRNGLPAAEVEIALGPARPRFAESGQLIEVWIGREPPRLPVIDAGGEPGFAGYRAFARRCRACARNVFALDAAEIPDACPICGEPLDVPRSLARQVLPRQARSLPAGGRCPRCSRPAPAGLFGAWCEQCLADAFRVLDIASVGAPYTLVPDDPVSGAFADVRLNGHRLGQVLVTGVVENTELPGCYPWGVVGPDERGPWTVAVDATEISLAHQAYAARLWLSQQGLRAADLVILSSSPNASPDDASP